MNSLFENFPEIISRASTSLYGLLALIVLATLILAMWLITQKATNRQERVLIYIMLFFATISGVVGVAAGFSSGSDVEVTEGTTLATASSPPEMTESIEANLYWVQLYEEDMEKLETYLEEKGYANSQESKTAALSDAIGYLVEESGLVPNEGKNGNSFQEALGIGQIGETKSVDDWIGNARPERYYRFQLLGDSTVRLIWSDGVRPNILNDEGRVVSWAGGDGVYTTSLNTGTYYIKVNRFPSYFEGDYQIEISAEPLQNP